MGDLQGSPPPVQMVVRDERPDDAAAVDALLERAFGGRAEADIVARLRESCPDRLELVAEVAGEVVGQVLFTPASVGLNGDIVGGMGLAPLAVEPAHQNRGIGSALVRTGLEALAERGCPYVVVLGHPSYYPRFGFEPAARHGMRCEWDVPEEAFMIRVLDPAVLGCVAGLVCYRSEWSAAV